MKEQNRDSLENFFSEGAQNHNIEFVESDWLNLKSQLDKEMPVGFSLLSFLRKYGIAFLLLLLFPIGWLSYDYFQNTDNRTSSDLAGSKDVNMSSIPPNESRTSFDTEKAEDLENTDQPHIQEASTISESINQSNLIIKDSDQSLQWDRVIYQNNIGEESKKIGQVVFEEGANTDRHRSNDQLLFLFAISPTFVIDNASLQKPESIGENNEVIPKKLKTSYFKVGVGYSPDFSTVGIGNFVSPGSRWMAMLEYGFLSRFAINTGVVLVNNKYEAYGEDYHAPARYWKKGIVAEEAYGECKMIDIPLNLRFDFIQNKKNKVFLSAGASTYFVTKEDYYFHYDQEDPDLPDHWGTDKTTIYPFGIINLSLGYEHEFTQRSGFQVEPFIKIPTTGIGWGNVDLHTIGVSFLYKYKL